jgi:hypothetical protein
MAAIFLPQQRQRHTAAAQLGMDMPQPRRRLRSRPRRRELALQRPRRRAPPAEGEIIRSLAAQAYFRPTTSRTFRIDNRRHRACLCDSQTEDLARLRLPTTPSASPYQQGGAFDRLGCRFPTESLAASPRFPHCRPSASTRGSQANAAPRRAYISSSAPHSYPTGDHDPS